MWRRGQQVHCQRRNSRHVKCSHQFCEYEPVFPSLYSYTAQGVCSRASPEDLLTSFITRDAPPSLQVNIWSALYVALYLTVSFDLRPFFKMLIYQFGAISWKIGCNAIGDGGNIKRNTVEVREILG
jgi:hypothetical protein